MSTVKDKTKTATQPPSLFGCFLGCFGISGNRIQPTEKAKPSSHRHRHRRRRYLSLSPWKFRRSKKDAYTKPVPVDHKSFSGKTISKHHAPAAAKNTVEIQVVEEDPTLTQKPLKKAGYSDEQIMVTDDFNEENLDLMKIPKKPQKHRRWSSFSSRKEKKAAAAAATTTVITRSQSQTLLSHSAIASPPKPLTHSISLPPTTTKKPPRKPTTPGVDRPNYPNENSDGWIGMSIILVVLVIMLAWGKLCAILCTCAWFFTAPRLRTVVDRSEVPTTTEKGSKPAAADEVDFDSAEYKKKVVLEGLLQRNKRNVGGFL